MNKTLKWVLIAIGTILIIVFVAPFILGLFSSLNPSGAVQKGQCVAQCNEKFEEENPLHEECVSLCAELAD